MKTIETAYTETLSARPEVGITYGQLTVTRVYKETPKDQDGLLQRPRLLAEVHCSCGTYLARVWVARLKNGKTQHCGCLKSAGACAGKAATQILAEDRSVNRLYNSWKGILSRCFDPKHRRYSDYATRAPTEPGWQDWAGFRRGAASAGIVGLAVGDTLDRVDNNLPYSFSNLRAANRKQQAINRSTTKYLQDLAGKAVPFRLIFEASGSGLKYNTAYARFFIYGWPLSRSLGIAPDKLTKFAENPATIDATAVSPSTLGELCGCI